MAKPQESGVIHRAFFLMIFIYKFKNKYMAQEKESIEIVLQAKIDNADGRDATHFRDRRVFRVTGSREDASKALSEFCEALEADNRFEQ